MRRLNKRRSAATATMNCARSLVSDDSQQQHDNKKHSWMMSSPSSSNSAGRALVAAIRRSSINNINSNNNSSNNSNNSDAAVRSQRNFSSGEDGSNKKSKNNDEEQNSAVDKSDDDDVGMRGGGSSPGSGATSLTLSLSYSLSPISVEHKVSLSCPPTQQKRQRQEQRRKLLMQSSSPSTPTSPALTTTTTTRHRHRQQHKSPTSPHTSSSVNSLHSTSPSQHSTSTQHSSISNASGTTNTSFNIIDDDQIITRLENECIKLNLLMSRMRKYTQDWFLLETKLKIANEELEAAKEDRDLHYYLGSPMPQPSEPEPEPDASVKVVGSIVMNDRNNNRPATVDDSEVGSPKGNSSVKVRGSELFCGEMGNNGDIDGGNSVIGKEVNDDGKIGIPETVLLHLDLMGEEASEPGNGYADAEVDGEQQPQQPELTGTEYDNNNDLDQNDENREIRLEYERVESQLQKVPKFSPEWFQLKEELVELKITLNADDYNEEEEELHDKPKEIEIEVVTSLRSSMHPTSMANASSGSALGNTHQLYAMAGDATEEDDTNNNNGNHYKKNDAFRPVSSRSPMSPRSPLPSRSLSPITPISPQQGRVASPYHSSSNSPYPSISNESYGSNSRRSSNASPNVCYSPYVLDYDYEENDDHSHGNLNNHSRDQEEAAETITILKTQHMQASRELNRHPQFSKEWFELKTMVVGIEDQIEEVENTKSCNSSSPDSSFNPKNKSFMSGWSSDVMSESEEEVMSYADDLECVMVAEALHRRRQSMYDGSDDEEEEAEFEYDDELLRMMQSDHEEENDEFENHMNIRVASTVKIQAFVRGRRERDEHRHRQEKATMIQSYLRKRWATLKYQRVLISIMTIQRTWRRYFEQQQSSQPKESAKEPDMSDAMMFDSMLDEFAFMLGNEEDDELEKQHFYAMIIQQWWRNCCACRPAMSTRRHTASYQGWAMDVEQKMHNHLQQQRNYHSAWQIFSVVLIQSLWRGHCARKTFRVLNSGLQLVKSSVAKIQSVVRGRRQHRHYRQLRENAIIIQSFLRKERASRQFKHVLSLIVRFQRIWRKTLPHLLLVKSRATKIQSLARGRQQRRSYVEQRNKSIVIQSFLRKERASTQFKHVLSSILRIQRFWRKASHCGPVAVVEAKNSDFDIFLEGMTASDEWDDVHEKQNYHALVIQDQWRIYESCKPVVSVRRRIVQSPQREKLGHGLFNVFAVLLIQARWRVYVQQREFKFVKSRVVQLQAAMRFMHQYRQYNRIRENAITIQSFVRKHWVAAGQFYTNQREVFFHSVTMGIRLQRGKDGFVRVLSVVEAAATSVESSILREGAIEPGDMVMNAAGVNLRSPITMYRWGEIVQKIRNAPRPMKFIVASGTRRHKKELLEECQHVSVQLQHLLSVLRVQHAWRKYCHMKHVQEEPLLASIVIQSYVRQWLACRMYKRERESAVLLIECEIMLIELKSLQAAILIQSHIRQWQARSSFSCKRKSSIRMQAFLQMAFHRKRYTQTLANVILIQGLAKCWLLRRNRAAIVIQSHFRRWIANSSFSQKRESIIRIQAFLAKESQRRQYTQTLTNLILIQGYIRGWLVRRNPPVDSPCDSKRSMDNEEFKETSSDRDERDDIPEKPTNVWLLRQQLERNDSAPIFPQNKNVPPSTGATPKQTKPRLTVDTPVTSQVHEDGPQESPENEENVTLASARPSVAKMRMTLEANCSSPIFPQNEVDPAKNKKVSTDSTQAIVPDARAGETWSPDTELRGINYNQNLEKFAKSESVRQSAPPTSTRSSRSSMRKHSRKKTEVTLEKKMRNLSIECIGLSARVKSLPKFSPEWRLSKLEMNLVSEELQHLYAESMAKGAQM